MGYLGIRGNADRCDDVIRILRNLGGVDSGNWNGSDDDNIYYINPCTKLIDAHSLIVFDNDDAEKLRKFWKMTIEDFDKQFPFKENDIVELVLDAGVGDKVFSKHKYVIVSVRWDHVVDEVEYGLAEYKPDTIFGKPEIFRNADEIRYYDESTDYESMGSLIVPDKPKTEILLFSLSDYKVEVDSDCIKVIKK